MESDANIYRLWVFEEDAIKHALQATRFAQPQPLHIVELSSRSNNPAINGARWIEDGRAILLLGASNYEFPQVYRLELQTGQLVKLTNTACGVANFESGSESLVYTGCSDRRPFKPSYPAESLDTQKFYQLYHGWQTKYFQTFSSYRGRDAQPVSVAFAGNPDLGPIYWISPNGKKALMKRRIHHAPEIPDVWKLLRAQTLQNISFVAQLLLIDLESGESHLLFDAPAVYDQTFNGVLWSADSNHVLIAGTSLPHHENRVEEEPELHVIDYDIASATWQIVESRALRNSDPDDPWHYKSIGGPMYSVPELKWIRPDREFSVSFSPGLDQKPAVYFLTNDTWRRRKAASQYTISFGSVRTSYGFVRPHEAAITLANGTRVMIRQSANEPPVAIASIAGKEIPLTSPDPKIATVHRAPIATVSWQSATTGQSFTAGLMLPSRSGAMRVPLVVQTYHYRPERFEPDGTQPTAYAAQALAAQGFAVLQIENGGAQDTPIAREGDAVVECIDSAVEYLDDLGLIDRARVGLVGFSRGAANVHYAVANPGRTRIAAAVAADGFTWSYGWYLYYAAEPGSEKTIEQLYGGSFWENKKEWLLRAPGFNLERIRTPVLLTAIGGGDGRTGSANLSADLEFVTGLRLNQRPFDYLYFPDAAHPMVRPRERFASLSSTVDWMRFWLMKKEDPDPAKSDQYARWRMIRSDWERVNLGETVSH